VMGVARSLGLTMRDLTCKGSGLAHYLKAIETDHADILNMRFHCPQDFLRILYHASDAVLANSSHEPFGLVGLETMAAGGIAFVGGTGEDYAVHLQNSIILETSDPKEIESYILYLNNHEEQKEILRRAGRHTARQYTWDRVIKSLSEKIENQARIQGLSIIRRETSWLESAERLEPARAGEPMLAGVA
jgi:glycosyltransferase involved in cell wall biosynthesis